MGPTYVKILKSLIHTINALFVLHQFDNIHSWQESGRFVSNVQNFESSNIYIRDRLSR